MHVVQSCTQEEDLSTHTFGLPLQTATSPKDSKLSKAKPCAAISLAEDQLLAARKESHHHAGASQRPEDDETTAVLARLRFAKAFLQVSLRLHGLKPLGLVMVRWLLLYACAVLITTSPWCSIAWAASGYRGSRHDAWRHRFSSFSCCCLPCVCY